jgi:hypothetical protein
LNIHNLSKQTIGMALIFLFLFGCSSPVVAPPSPEATFVQPIATLVPATATSIQATLPPIPDMFPRINQAECAWQTQILSAWSRKMEDQTETLTFNPDNTLLFTYKDKPGNIRVGTYICEEGGTLKIFTLLFVDGKSDFLMNLGRIEVSFPSPDTLVMDIKPADEVWTFARVK